MTDNIFDPKSGELPATIPVFPLTGVLLLPDGSLPLNIFEPRYIAMIDHAMRNGRLVGMVQPVQPNERDNFGGLAGVTDPDDERVDPEAVERELAALRGEPEKPSGKTPALYETGCVGRIVQFEETDDGRYIVVLKGLSRFRIVNEHPVASGGYRTVDVSWDEYGHDLLMLQEASSDSGVINRDQLIPSLKTFFDLHGLSADWEAIERTPDDKLVTTLCMICPFAPGEKQALLEAPDLNSRAEIMQTLIDMAAHQGDDAPAIRH